MTNTDNYYKLDNPAWYSLTETHRHFAVGNDIIRRYEKNIAPFIAIHPDWKNNITGLDQWTSPGDSFFLIGDTPSLPVNYRIESRLDCLQMTGEKVCSIVAAAVMEGLCERNDEEMKTLINLVQPGYYNSGTRLMGDYFGIRINGHLVAMTGERMRMDGLTEISAVVTHPDFTGRGHARQLVSYVANKNLLSGVIPFLHVAASNERAINLYRHLGFVERRVIAFWKINRMR